MSDPDRTNDSEPTGRPLASAESPGSDADEATTPNDASGRDVPAGASERDTDDFLRWLPTLALGHRRRAQLVERPSSDGADFAAYAGDGRPASASGQPRLESAVNVQVSPRGGGPQGSKDPERDAPTVLTRERSARRTWRIIGWGAVGLCASGAAVAAWVDARVAIDKPLGPREGVATAPVPSGQTVAPPIEAPQPLATLSAVQSWASAQASDANAARAAAGPMAAPATAPVTGAARKAGSAGAPRAIDLSAKGRAARSAAAPTAPAKDQFFEEP
jgi:hypothetical protein